MVILSKRSKRLGYGSTLMNLGFGADNGCEFHSDSTESLGVLEERAIHA